MLECAKNSTVNENLFDLQLGYLTPDLILRSIQLKIYIIITDDDDDGDRDNYSIIIIIELIVLYTAFELQQLRTTRETVRPQSDVIFSGSA